MSACDLNKISCLIDKKKPINHRGGHIPSTIFTKQPSSAVSVTPQPTTPTLLTFTGQLDTSQVLNPTDHFQFPFTRHAYNYKQFRPTAIFIGCAVWCNIQMHLKGFLIFSISNPSVTFTEPARHDWVYLVTHMHTTCA